MDITPAGRSHSRRANTVCTEAFAAKFDTSIRESLAEALARALFDRHVAVHVDLVWEHAIGDRVGVAAFRAPAGIAWFRWRIIASILVDGETKTTAARLSIRAGA